MARLKGLEPLTHCLEGSCSIQLSYRRISVDSRPLPSAKPAPFAASFAGGAGDGNRTHATSLEGWDSTIELHPQMLCLTLTLNYYNTFILICQGLFAIIFNFLQNIWAVEFSNRFLVVFRLKITPRKS